MTIYPTNTGGLKDIASERPVTDMSVLDVSQTG